MPWMIPRLLKNLWAGPVTWRYPSTPRIPISGGRGTLSHDAERCDLCGDCVRLCPARALELDEAAKKLSYNPFRCIYCLVCADSCQHGAVTALPAHEVPAPQPQMRMWK